jgi:hypothetical protein
MRPLGWSVLFGIITRMTGRGQSAVIHRDVRSHVVIYRERRARKPRSQVRSH